MSTAEGPDRLPRHCRTVLRYLINGTVVPFFGAGVHMCDRTPEVFQYGVNLPSGSELSEALIDNAGEDDDSLVCDDCRDDVRKNLLTMSQYLWDWQSGWVVDKLYDIFRHTRGYDPSRVIRFFAELRGQLKSVGVPDTSYRPLLYVTTNYDHVLEKDLERNGMEFDVVSYEMREDHRGVFVHYRNAHNHYRAIREGTVNYEEEFANSGILIDVPNTYSDLPIDSRNRLWQSIILKIHGTAHPNGSKSSSFVVTESHYIDYLMQFNPAPPLPAQLLSKMKESQFLFLGYSLQDWNIRVLLTHLWRLRRVEYKSWAIYRGSNCVDRKVWEQRKVEILPYDLRDYFTTLDQELEDVLRKMREQDE